MTSSQNKNNNKNVKKTNVKQKILNWICTLIRYDKYFIFSLYINHMYRQLYQVPYVVFYIKFLPSLLNHNLWGSFVFVSFKNTDQSNIPFHDWFIMNTCQLPQTFIPCNYNGFLMKSAYNLWSVILYRLFNKEKYFDMFYWQR